MALDSIFSEATVHRLAARFDVENPWSAHRVTGRRLRPFSLWHQALLQQIDSPLLTASREISLHDIDIATSVCRCLYPAVAFRRRSNWSLLWRSAAGGLPRARDAFIDYLNDFLSPPRYKIIRAEQTGPPPMPCGRPPEVLSTFGAIVAWSHWPEIKVWNLPVGIANWYAALAIEAGGSQVDFEDDELRLFWEAAQSGQDHKAAPSASP